MTFGLDFDKNRTDCPEGAALTVAELLTFPAVLTGAPQIFAEPGLLKRPLHWAHVLENLRPQEYLRGGELVLTTGIGWGPAPDFQRFAKDLASAGVPALILELGDPVANVPPGLVSACRAHDLVLVAMHRKVAFVEITGALHEYLFRLQTRRVEAGGEVTTHFIDLMQRGAPAHGILNSCAQLLDAPVILEDQGYNALRHAAPTVLSHGYFEAWQENSRREHEAGNPHRYAAPVQLNGKRYGSLICPPTAQHAAGVEHVLTMAAAAIAVDLLQRPGSLAWSLGTGQQLLDELMHTRQQSPGRLEQHFEAAGFPVDQRLLYGFAYPLVPADSVRDVVERLRHSISPHPVLAAEQLCGGQRVAAGLISCPRQQKQTPSLEVPLAAAATELAGGPLYLGPAGQDLTAAGESLNQALAGVELGLQPQSTLVLTDNSPLALLAHELRHEPSLQRLPRLYLAPLFDLPERKRGEYLTILQSCLDHPTNRTEAARRSHLSRSVFYQKLAILERLLGVELNDPAVLTVLTLAMAVHRQGQGTPHG